MKYLVHETTKEHVIWESGMPTSAPGYKCVEADEEGWIPWEGGECPLPASNQAEVKLQDGKQGSFDSIPLMTHRSWQKWNCGGDIIAYRPILEAAEKAAAKESFATETVFDRLKSAIAASESIPAIIAEIDSLLPEGYCVTRCDVQPSGEPVEQPAEDMSDWRNWRKGDLVECIVGEGWDAFTTYGIYKITKQAGRRDIGVEIEGYPVNEHISDFRFHSRPAKVTE